MRYMLMVCQDESTVGDAQEMRTDPEGFAWFEEMDHLGLLRGGGRLGPTGDATTVRVRDEEVPLSDGPFAESKEQRGGYNLIEWRRWRRLWRAWRGTRSLAGRWQS